MAAQNERLARSLHGVQNCYACDACDVKVAAGISVRIRFGVWIGHGLEYSRRRA